MTNVGHILFSLPVHERPDILENQLSNIRKFCPRSTVMVHLSSSTPSIEIPGFERACDMENVILNPIRRETKHGSGLLHVHIQNFFYAEELNIIYDRICLISSNEMFIRSGAEQVMMEYQAGSQMEIFDRTANWHLFRNDLLEFLKEKKFLDTFFEKLSFPIYFGGQAEGQYYNKKIFYEIAKMYNRFLPMGPAGFETEEVIPPTVAAILGIIGNNIGLPITFCDYTTNFKFSENDVLRIRSENGVFFSQKPQGYLRNPHLGLSSLKNIFSIKRVQREMVPLRKMITNLTP